VDKAEFGLYELLLDRITADTELDERATGLLLAAWLGDDALEAAIDGEMPELPTADGPSGPSNPEVFLSAIHVRGFRGIGPHARLALPPGPGLTLVTGRNGSGKSSFAEAAELTLTGDCGRWSGRTAVWRDGWRNLHDAADSSVAVDLVSAGTSGVTRILREWQPGADLADSTWSRQLRGAKREPFDAAEWREDLLAYRPFLSYRELGDLISGKPSELHDALKSVLGLGPLAAAHDRLTRARKLRSEPERAAGKVRRDLRALLVNVDDERAARAAALLRSTNPDLAAVGALVQGTGDDSRPAALRELQALQVPDAEIVAAATRRIRAAMDRVAAAATADVRSADTAGSLLRAALRHHDETGEGPCPVCESGTLDAGWRTQTEARADELDASVTQLRAAVTGLKDAEHDARLLAQPVPAALTAAALDRTAAGDGGAVLDGGAAVDGDAVAVACAAATEAWRRWADAADHEQPIALADALDETAGSLRAAVTGLKAQAEAELARLDGVWAPYARALAAWLYQAEEAEDAVAAVADLTAAEKWLAATSDELRDRRLAPFAEASQRVWGMLRQQSNVELGPIHLTGSHTRRVAKLDVRVDGAEGTSALSVMSQGELHSLALSLFLPRATVDDSPFRFVVIDDPVQAMDPAKVDGLARVLADAARERQVVVFTHDDRLAEAVRRLELTATVYEVQRGERSVVTLRRCEHPVGRYLDDARAVARTPQLSAALKGELVASYCRSAIEAACHTRIRAKQLGAGAGHTRVEQLLRDAHNTSKILSLALFDDPDRPGDVATKLGVAGPEAVNAYRCCKQGAHQGVSDPEGLIRDTGQLTDWLAG